MNEITTPNIEVQDRSNNISDVLPETPVIEEDLELVFTTPTTTSTQKETTGQPKKTNIETQAQQYDLSDGTVSSQNYVQFQSENQNESINVPETSQPVLTLDDFNLPHYEAEIEVESIPFEENPLATEQLVTETRNHSETGKSHYAFLHFMVFILNLCIFIVLAVANSGIEHQIEANEVAVNQAHIETQIESSDDPSNVLSDIHRVHVEGNTQATTLQSKETTDQSTEIKSEDDDQSHTHNIVILEHIVIPPVYERVSSDIESSEKSDSSADKPFEPPENYENTGKFTQIL